MLHIATPAQEKQLLARNPLVGDPAPAVAAAASDSESDAWPEEPEEEEEASEEEQPEEEQPEEEEYRDWRSEAECEDE
jgi:hypothetical protein